MDENLKKTEIINKIIILLLEDFYKMFKNQENVYSRVPVYSNKFDTSFIYSINKNNGKYFLKFRLLDKVKKNLTNKSCYYCQDHRGDFVYTCCNSTFNLSCGILNNYLCPCSYNRSQIKKSKNIEECSICLENTIYKTKCGHPLCNGCLDDLKKSDNNLLCPICRKEMSILDICEYENLKIKVDNIYINCNILFSE